MNKEKQVKAGDLVFLCGSILSSYSCSREGQTGLVLETQVMHRTMSSGYPDAEFSLVVWNDGQWKLYKSSHLVTISESR